METRSETTEKQKASLGSPLMNCSASFANWTKKRGVWPRLTHEEIYRTAWNDAIKAADSVAWEKRDQWDEGNGYSPTKAAAAEEIGYAIRRLSEPNADGMGRRTLDADSK